MNRIKVTIAGQVVNFADRETAIRQMEDLAERGTILPVVV